MKEDTDVNFILEMNEKILNAEDPLEAATARLSRSIGQVVPPWVKEEIERETKPSDILLALVYVEAAITEAIMISFVEKELRDMSIKELSKAFYLFLRDFNRIAGEREDGEPQGEGERR
jgi:hypothetical protein